MSLRIVVLGYVVRCPLGGMAWHHLNYVLGLAALGHEVLFLEDSDDYPSCYDPSRHTIDTDPTCGLAFAKEAFDWLGLGECWAYFDAHRNAWHGPMCGRAAAFCCSADLLLNISGVNPLRDWSAAVPLRALVDTDPAFTQLRHLNEPARLAFARRHNRFFTFGENIATGTAAVPGDGLPWRATRQPVALRAWPFTPPRPDGPITTVMQWNSYPAQRHGGVEYGMKSRSFENYLDLPHRTGEPLTVAVSGPSVPRERLAAHGWILHETPPIHRDPWTYQQYIQSAAAEWSVAKHGYVAGRTGWFSERSACFLATGRPVLLQDTGYSDVLPTGRGLLSFSTAEESAEALVQLRGDYQGHCRAARRLAEQFFESGRVLGDLLDRVMTEPNARETCTVGTTRGE